MSEPNENKGPAEQKKGKNISKRTRYIVEAGLIAAAYAALTYLSSLWGLAYGQVQFRVSEAMTILPVFTPAAIPGLTIGCILGNLTSPYGLVDIVFGSLATLFSSLLVYAVRHVCVKIRGYRVNFLAPLFPVLCNAIIVGIEINLFLPEGLSWAGFAAAALSVGAGELIMCYGLGIPLSVLVEKLKIFKS